MRQDPVSRAYSHCLQGDVRPAIRLLKRSQDRLSSHGLRLLSGLRRRFEEKRLHLRLGAADALTCAVIRTYRHYYTDVLSGRLRTSEAEGALQERLIRDLRRHANGPPSSADLQTIEWLVADSLKSQGLFCLAGRIVPHRHIHVWTREDVRTYHVELPSGRRRCTVRFVDGFLDQGWSHYATLGRYFAGGWADAKEITCVRKAYDLASERFRVSLLAHEAQHQADYEAFPRLGGADLEFRAKLVELSLTRWPNRLAESFRRQAAPKPGAAHAFAAFVLIEDLASMVTGRRRVPPRAVWTPVAPARVRSAARELLDLHTQALRASTSAHVKELIGRPAWMRRRP